MIGLSRALSVFAYTEPCDMRKPFNTLTALVEEQMQRNVLAACREGERTQRKHQTS